MANHKSIFRCRRCLATGPLLQVAGAGNSRTVRGRKRQAQHVRCTKCGHEWFSISAEAVRRGRDEDAAWADRGAAQ